MTVLINIYLSGLTTFSDVEDALLFVVVAQLKVHKHDVPELVPPAPLLSHLCLRTQTLPMYQD